MWRRAREGRNGIDSRVEVDLGIGGERAVLCVRGELDLALAPRLARAIDRLQGSDVREVVVDLTDVSFVDSAGMRVLVNGTKQLSSIGASFRVRGTTPAVHRRLSLTGLDRILSFEWPSSADRDRFSTK